MGLNKHRYEEIHMKENSHETRIALLEQSISHINETLIRFDKKFDKLEEIIKDFQKEIYSKFDTELKHIGNRSWLQFGFLFLMITGVLGILAKTQGWI